MAKHVYFDSRERIKIIFFKKLQLAKEGQELSLNVGSETQLWRHNDVKSMLFCFSSFFAPPRWLCRDCQCLEKKKKKITDKDFQQKKEMRDTSIERTIP